MLLSSCAVPLEAVSIQGDFGDLKLAYGSNRPMLNLQRIYSGE